MNRTPVCSRTSQPLTAFMCLGVNVGVPLRSLFVSTIVSALLPFRLRTSGGLLGELTTRPVDSRLMLKHNWRAGKSISVKCVRDFELAPSLFSHELIKCHSALSRHAWCSYN